MATTEAVVVVVVVVVAVRWSTVVDWWWWWTGGGGGGGGGGLAMASPTHQSSFGHVMSANSHSELRWWVSESSVPVQPHPLGCATAAADFPVRRRDGLGSAPSSPRFLQLTINCPITFCIGRLRITSVTGWPLQVGHVEPMFI